MDKVISNEKLDFNELTIIRPKYPQTDFYYEVDSNNVLSIKHKTNNIQRINRFNGIYSIGKEANKHNVGNFKVNIKLYKKKLKLLSKNLTQQLKRYAKRPCKNDKDFISYSLKNINKLYTALLYNPLDIPLKHNKLDSPFKRERLTKVTFSPKETSVTLTLKPGFNCLYRAFTGNYSPLSLPPKKKTSLGRLNKAKKPVFYLAMSPETTKKEVPNYKVIYQYEVIRPIKLQLSFASQFTTPIFDEETIKIGCILASIFNEILALKSSNTEIQRKYYKLTNELMDRYIRTNNIDGIVYPSVKRKGIPIEVKKGHLKLNLEKIDLILLNGKNPQNYLKKISKIK